jgi:cytochrome oxidase Cu insertion factor (SCO1/SenC/PrrC family)
MNHAGTALGGPARRRPRIVPFALLAAAAVLIGVALGLLVRGSGRPAGSAPTAAASLGAGGGGGAGLRGEATWAAGARPAPAIVGLRDQTGRAFSLGALRGRPVALTFFDSHCHAACPLEGRALAAAETALPAAARPVLVVVSVNPADTPASSRHAARAWGLARLGAWHWLIGSRRVLARAWRSYRISVLPTPGDITHTEAIYLLDRRGDERSAYLFPFAPRFVTHDLRVLGSGSGADSRSGSGGGVGSGRDADGA